jgi:hypothetical protein
MKPIRVILITAVAAMLWLGSGAAQSETEGIDAEVIIERILSVEQERRAQVNDVIFDAEYVEGETKDGEFVEKVRFDKKIYIKFLEDTAWFNEEYLAYYKEGEEKSQEDLEKEARDRLEKKKKRKARDISFPMLTPFEPDQRELYDIRYVGITSEPIDGNICHEFRVESIEGDPDRMNGDFYFDADSFNLVRVDFTPSKLASKFMFKMKELNMSIRYGPSPDGYWLPKQFDIQGKGKAAFFIGVKFAGSEYYRNPMVNTGIDDSRFEVSDDD